MEVECPYCFEVLDVGEGTVVDEQGHILEYSSPLGEVTARKDDDHQWGRDANPVEEREQIEDTYPELASTRPLKRKVLRKALEKRIRGIGDGKYFLLRDRGHQPYAVYCRKCDSAWKIYQSPCHSENCPNG